MATLSVAEENYHSQLEQLKREGTSLRQALAGVGYSHCYDMFMPAHAVLP